MSQGNRCVLATFNVIDIGNVVVDFISFIKFFYLINKLSSHRNYKHADLFILSPSFISVLVVSCHTHHQVIRPCSN